MENSWSFSVSRVAQYFSFFSTVRAEAWNLPGTILFAYIENFDPDLADAEHWAMVHVLCVWGFLLGPECLNFRLQCGTRPWNTLQNGLNFHLLLLLIFHARLVVVERGREAVTLAWSLAMKTSWDWAVVSQPAQSSLGTQADCVLSVSVVQTASSGGDGRMVCWSMSANCRVRIPA